MRGRFKPEDDASVRRLRDHVRAAYKELEFARRERLRNLKEYVGMHYSRDGTSDRVAIPLIRMLVDIYMRKIAARRPRVLVTTEIPQLKPSAEALRTELDYSLQRMRIERDLQRVAKDAIFTMGVMRVAIKADDPLGRAAARRIPFDDWFHDPMATQPSECAYMGHRYRAPFFKVKNNKSYRAETRAKLQPTFRQDVREEIQSRAEEISIQASVEGEEYGTWIDLIDAWLPEERLLVTLPWRGEGLLRALPWDGPEHGMYHTLAFAGVPDNFLPASPVQMGIDLHLLENELFLKSARQAGNSKTVFGFREGSESDAMAIADAYDFDMKGMADPDSVKAFKTGGVEPTSFALMMQIKQLFSWVMGNLDMLGGLGPQSETLGQDQLLAAGASQQIADMQAKTVDFTRDVVTDLAFYEWERPRPPRTVWRQIPGTNIRVQSSLGPGFQGAFPEYDLDLVPYSMQDQSPQERFQSLMTFLTQFAIPALPLIERSGGAIDMRKVFAIFADYKDLPELNEVFTFAQGPAEGATLEGLGKPASTTRRYEQVRRPGATHQGQTDILTRALMAGGTQGTEMDALMRSVG